MLKQTTGKNIEYLKENWPEKEVISFIHEVDYHNNYPDLNKLKLK